MGIVNAGQLAVYDDIEPELRERVEDVVLNRRPDAAERLLALASATAGTVRRRRKPIWRGANGRWSDACRTPSSMASLISSPLMSKRRAWSAPPARRDRRPAHGRHECRRRSVRLWPHVPAAGREIGAGDEAGRRSFDALHGAAAGTAGRIRRRTARSCSPPSRATCMTSARTSSASSLPATITTSSISA